MFKLEYFNEVILLGLCDCLPLFTDFVVNYKVRPRRPDLKLQEDIGTAFLSILGCLFLINIGRAIYMGVKKPIKTCRLKCKRNKYRKEQALKPSVVKPAAKVVETPAPVLSERAM